MKLHELCPAEGARKSRKRVGRGKGSGHGKTSCRGHKGQKARSGGGVKRGFEGGQMPLIRRIPKRGFVSPFRKEYQLVNLADLEDRFSDGDLVTLDALKEKGLIKYTGKLVKILASGELKKSLEVSGHKFSKEAERKILDSNGKVQVLT